MKFQTPTRSPSRVMISSCLALAAGCAVGTNESGSGISAQSGDAGGEQGGDQGSNEAGVAPDTGKASTGDGGKANKDGGGADASSSIDSGPVGPIQPGLSLDSGAIHYYDATQGIRLNQNLGGGGAGKDGVSYFLPSGDALKQNVFITFEAKTVPGNYLPVGDYDCASTHSSLAFGTVYMSFGGAFSLGTKTGECTMHVLSSQAGGATATATWNVTGTFTGSFYDYKAATLVPVNIAFNLDYSN